MTIDARSGLAGRPIAVPMLVLPLTIAATFLSAALLFSVQPMFTKLVLPILGGSSSVWSVAMVFFQALLLLGYGYAHVLARTFGPRLALPIHLGLMVVALVTLPVALPAGWMNPPAHFEALWLLALFGLVVGLPFFALSANGPLLQSWFSRTAHKDAGEPYFLYAASNVGSFAALLLYPVAIEPFLQLKDQTDWWAKGFLLLGVLIALAGWQMLRSQRVQQAAVVPTKEVVAVSWKQRLIWVGLSLVPSGLLVSVTAHISTDVAAVPLLWVAPLALFLLTFVLTFSERRRVPMGQLTRVQVWLTALALLSLVLKFDIWLNIALHLCAFFTSALVCHKALYARRPAAARLTEFYFFMSLGGCVGGIFAGLLAPQIFNTVLEYPILLLAALFCRPGFFSDARSQAGDAARAAAACLALIALGYLMPTSVMPGIVVQAGLATLFGLVLVFAWKSPLQVAAAGVAMGLCAAVLTFSAPEAQISRSFFGVHKVSTTTDGRFRLLMHGTTVHGAMRLLNEDGTVVTGRPVVPAYYADDGAIAAGVAAIRAAQGGALQSAAVIGLGTGALACHIAKNERLTFFEIDPEVVAIATDPNLFSFLSQCAPTASIILGDARLTFAEGPRENDLIVIDAFSSDSIPAHLLTTEAFEIYLDRLAPDGAMLVHISNRNLDLSRIIARTAGAMGLVTYMLDESDEVADAATYRLTTTVVALARSPADLGTLSTDGIWHEVQPDMTRRPWTDDFSNILEAIFDKARR